VLIKLVNDIKLDVDEFWLTESKSEMRLHERRNRLVSGGIWWHLWHANMTDSGAVKSM